MCCIIVLFVLVRLKLVLSSVPHCTSQIPSPFHLFLFSYSASLVFLLFTPHGSSCTASIQQLYDTSRCLFYQHGKNKLFSFFFLNLLFLKIVGTAKWLVFKSNPKVKIRKCHPSESQRHAIFHSAYCGLSAIECCPNCFADGALCFPSLYTASFSFWALFPLIAFPLQLKISGMLLLADIYWFQCEFW